MIQQVLEETGRFHATVVGSAAQALEAASRAVFDAALIEAAVADLALPDLVTALRLNQPVLTVVVVLPFGEDSLPASARSLDIQAVLTKPLYIPDLQAQIEGALAKPVNGVVPPVRAPAPSAPKPPAPTPAAPPPAAPKAAPSKRPAPPPAWLEDVNRAAQYLTGLTLESSAEAALLMRGQRLIAFAGQGGQAEAEELSRMVAASWARDSESGQGSQARFLRLSNGADYLVYSTLAAEDVVLSMAFQAETPLGQIRKQAKRATTALFATPADASAIPGTGPLPAAPSPAPGPATTADPLPQNFAPAAQPVPVAPPTAVEVLNTPGTPEPATPAATPAPVEAEATLAEPVAAEPLPVPADAPLAQPADFAEMPAIAPVPAEAEPEPAEPPAPALPFDPTLYERMMLAEGGAARPAEWSAPPDDAAPEAAPAEGAEVHLHPSRVKTKQLPPLPDFAPDMRGFPDPHAYQPEAAPSLDTRPLSEVPDTVTLADAIKAAPMPPELEVPPAEQKDTLQAWLNVYQAETSGSVIALPPAAQPEAPSSPSADAAPAPDQPAHDPDGASWFNLYRSRTEQPVIALPPASETAQSDWSYPPPRLPADMPAVPPPEPEAAFATAAEELPEGPALEEDPFRGFDRASLPVTQPLPELPDWVPASPGRQLTDSSQADEGLLEPEPAHSANLENAAASSEELAGPEPAQDEASPAFTPPFAPEDTLETDLDVEPLPDADALEALSRKLQALERQSLVEQPPLLDLPPTPWPNIRRTPHGLYDLSYSFIFVPRHGHVNLSGDIKGRLEHWLVSLAEFHDWEVTTLAVDDDHVEISLKCPPADSPERIMKTVLAETSDKIMEEYPRLAISHGKRPGAFWASGYYVVTPGRRFLPEEVQAFVEYQRREQGGKL